MAWKRKIVHPNDNQFFPWFQKVIKAPQLQYPTSAVEVVHNGINKRFKFLINWIDEDVGAIEVAQWTEDNDKI